MLVSTHLKRILVLDVSVEYLRLLTVPAVLRVYRINPHVGHIPRYSQYLVLGALHHLAQHPIVLRVQQEPGRVLHHVHPVLGRGERGRGTSLHVDIPKARSAHDRVDLYVLRPQKRLPEQKGGRVPVLSQDRVLATDQRVQFLTRARVSQFAPAMLAVLLPASAIRSTTGLDRGGVAGRHRGVSRRVFVRSG